MTYRGKHGSVLLRRWREENGLTQAEAGKYLGFHDTEVCMYEKMTRKPADKRRMRMKKLCGIPWEAWL